ncbi:MAG: CBM9 family sugar-binding protein [Armatimonadetes bacterium]|nr:CBM9 family sugar-binding protein [Armatimonadota bacterium]
MRRLPYMLAFLVISQLCLSDAPAFADADTTAPPAPVAPAAPVAAPADPQTPAITMPALTPDTELFRRTPIIDGVVEDGEWDAFYTFNTGGWEATTFADWDSGNLYVAAKSNKPVDMMIVLDAHDDGWFHGEDNYEFRAVRAAADALTVTVARYESKNSKSPVATPVTPEETAMVEVKSTRTATAYMIEMRVPTLLVRGLKLAAGRKIGFQIDLSAGLDALGWVPSSQPGETKECTLVTKKFASLKPLDMGFDLRYGRIARGEDLIGRLHLTNAGTETVDARTIVVAGEGKAGDYLSSEKVRVEGVGPKKHFSHDVRSLIPSDMRTGSWAVGAEVRSGTERLGSALVSFDVVEPFEIELRLPAKDVRADVKDVTFGVAIRNNMRRDIRGTAKITLPTGWELWRNADTREFEVPSDAVSSAGFKAKPPLGILGDVPVKVQVTVNGLTKTAEGKIVIVNP